ncbi:DUF305 domain-containing protein [Streptomyces sp. NPDC051940]|uniref:DUF305 domain-containing protein n=1 Tax=Streptomyces sp. NPDC051940 TaxID=3155675 RepID=UPI0034283D7C
MSTPHVRREAIVSYARSLSALLAVAVLALTGCTDDDAKEGGKGGPAVIQPGKPGESGRTLSPEEAAEAGKDDAPNAADYAYVQMMIKHHEQALVMTDLAADRASSDKVGKLAERIAAAQGPEIRAMKGWLEQNDGTHRHDGHDHASMPGMATAAQLEQLRGARGKAFDELFLTLMITHHEGAITMATDVLGKGNNVMVEQMANDVVAQQTAEIGRMRGLL